MQPVSRNKFQRLKRFMRVRTTYSIKQKRKLYQYPTELHIIHTLPYPFDIASHFLSSFEFRPNGIDTIAIMQLGYCTVVGTRAYPYIGTLLEELILRRHESDRITLEGY